MLHAPYTWGRGEIDASEHIKGVDLGTWTWAPAAVRSELPQVPDPGERPRQIQMQNGTFHHWVPGTGAGGCPTQQKERCPTAYARGSARTLAQVQNAPPVTT